MTGQASGQGEPRDPFEERLAGRVRELSERGVRPIDAAEIARAAASASGAAMGGPGFARRFGSSVGQVGRLAWMVGGVALLGAVLLGGAALSGGRLFGVVTPSPSQASASEAAPASPSATGPVAVAECSTADLAARVVDWTGAAGSRIADVTVRNVGSAACSLATLDRPQLVDDNADVLIDGNPPTGGASLTLAPGGTATTEVEVSNYCGPDPAAPVSVAFVLPNGERLVAVPRSADDLAGVPPCNGRSAPANAAMQPWGP
jgi:hypothetical protein